MSVVRHTIHQPRSEVFRALVTPETYPHWLVGARDIRAVDDRWPAVGSTFHHQVGLVGPLKVADSTKVLAIEADRLLSLEVRARPFGRGRATFRLSDAPGDEGAATVLELDEVPLGMLAPARPLVDPLTAIRNRRSLAQLDDLLSSGRSHRAPG
ncbi:MAG: hypothetical protein JWM47_2942 [Acidimicrobiales bacterium]|nr:hypothetical protein [Acidimicrobiales bacterium]